MTNINVVYIPDNTNYWFMRSNGGEFYPDFKFHNFIAIDGNDVQLEDLYSIDDKIREIPSALKEAYRNTFKDAYNQKILSGKLTPHAVTLRSSQTYMFVEEMKIGDIVIVPSAASLHFLIGIIVSDPTENEIQRNAMIDDNDFAECPYIKRRKVLWIKEIPREQLPNNVSGIIYSHQGLLNINHYAEQINSLIALLNYHKNQLHLTLRVETLDPINSVTWLDFQRLIVDVAGAGADEIYQKKSVESPGEIILETVLKNWEAIIAIYAVLFGEVDFKGFRFSGLISRHFPSNKRLRKLQEESIRLDNEKKQAEINKCEAETRQIYNNIVDYETQSNDAIQQLEPSITDFQKTKTEPPQLSEYGSVESMELSNSEFGTEVSMKNQMDNLNI